MPRLCLALLFAVLTAGCPRIEGQLPSPSPPTPAEALRGGAARVDITPVPGYRMAGHGDKAKLALGVWTRLKARALVLHDRAGTPVVLVACDLWAIPSGLSDRVAELVAGRPALRHIGRQHLVLAATHTHNGPAAYLSARPFNDAGFDPDLFEFLAQRIALAIERAAADVQPVTVRRSTVAVPSVARNDNPAAFATNPEAEAMRRVHATLQGCPDAGGPDPCHAVDPRLEVLHVANDDGTTVAAAAFFAVHATAMPRRTELYHGDLFATAAIRAERNLDSGAVALIFTGAQGDVVPNLEEPGRAGATALGHHLADAVVAATRESSVELDGPFSVAFARAAIADTSLGEVRTGQTRQPYPTNAPLSAVQLGTTVLATLPGEFTTVLGRRIARSVSRHAGSPQDAILVGLAGGYLAHFTTPQEYEAQQQAGLQVLYGPHAGALVSDHLARIASSRPVRVESTYAYRPGQRRRHRLTRSALGGRRLATAAERIATQLSAIPRRRFPSLEFRDARPAWPPAAPDAPVTPRVRVEVERAQGWEVLGTDETGAVAVFLTGADRDGLTYTAVWLTPDTAAPAEPMRIRADTIGRDAHCSAEFSAADVFGETLATPVPSSPC